MNQPAPSLGESRPTNVRWIIFALCCGTSWMLYLHRYVFSLIKNDLQAELHLDEVQLGQMDSAFYLAYLSFQVPSGLVSDLLGMQWFLGGSIIGWAIFVGLQAWAPNSGWLYAIRFQFGVFQSGAYPVLSSITRVWFPRSVRTTLQGWIASFFGRFGGACANILFATVLLGLFGLDWRTALVILSVAGVLFGAAFCLFFRDSPRQHPWCNDAEAELIEFGDRMAAPPPSSAAEPTVSFKQLWRQATPKGLWNLGALVFQQFMASFADSVFVVWLPFFLQKVHNLEFKAMGIYSALPLIGGALGGMTGGVLNDALFRWTDNRRWARSIVGTAGQGAACFFTFAALLAYDNPYLFCCVLFFAKYFSDMSQPTVWGTCTDISGRAAATIFAINNGVGGIGGLVAPPLLGWVAKEYSWTAVFAIIGITYFWASVPWLAINCTVPVFREDEPEAPA